VKANSVENFFNVLIRPKSRALKEEIHDLSKDQISGLELKDLY
jgi:hypothetical protein